MKNIWKKCRKAFPFLLLAAVILTVAFYPVPQESQGETARIVSVWNVDTFEGGKGSRTSFLKRVARLAEKSSGETYYRVISYTVEGARAAMLNGEYPDILSFGVGPMRFPRKNVCGEFTCRTVVPRQILSVFSYR